MFSPPSSRLSPRLHVSNPARIRPLSFVFEPDALALNDDSPVRLGRGDVLVPIVRNNDRYGNMVLDKTAEIPWTLLQVTGSDRTNANLLECNVYSGMRSPIRGRSSSRRERYALGSAPATQRRW